MFLDSLEVLPGLLQAAMENGFVWLAVIAGINTAISVYYYWRIVKVMYLEKGEDESPLVLAPALNGFVLVLTLPILWLFFSPTVTFIRNLELWQVN